MFLSARTFLPRRTALLRRVPRPPVPSVRRLCPRCTSPTPRLTWPPSGSQFALTPVPHPSGLPLSSYITFPLSKTTPPSSPANQARAAKDRCGPPQRSSGQPKRRAPSRFQSARASLASSVSLSARAWTRYVHRRRHPQRSAFNSPRRRSASSLFRRPRMMSMPTLRSAALVTLHSGPREPTPRPMVSLEDGEIQF